MSDFLWCSLGCSALSVICFLAKNKYEKDQKGYEKAIRKFKSSPELFPDQL